MNEQEKIGWELAQMEYQSGKKRSMTTYNELSQDAAAAYDEHWSQIELSLGDLNRG